MKASERRLPATSEHLRYQFKKSMEDQGHRQQLLKLLSKTPIFADTREAFRTCIAKALVPVEFSKDDVIFRQGQRGDWLGILLSGRAQRSYPLGLDDLILGEVCPGGIVGDLGVLGIDTVRSFTITATSPCSMLALSRDAFQQAVAEAGGQVIIQLAHDAERMGRLEGGAEFFSKLQCLRCLEQECVVAMWEASEPRLYYPQQVLMREQEVGHDMFIIRAGKVKIEQGGQFIVELGSGVVVGELAVFGADKRRTATVTCTSLCFTHVLHSDVVHSILEKFPAAKRTFDHKYITRLVSIEMRTAREELAHLDGFFGAATPKTKAEVEQLLESSATNARRAPPSKLPLDAPVSVPKPITLPPILSR